jgi:NitT/TauT family transport system substrate-binding protein
LKCTHAAALAAIIAIISTTNVASAQDRLKVVIGQINNWENQATSLGQKIGIFKKYNLELELVGSQGSGESLQAIISGAGDIGIGVGTGGAMRAFSRGAPIRIFAAAFTGASDLYWYVPAKSPIKSLKDATDANTIAFSSSGSSTNTVVLAFRDQLGVKAKPTATGSPAGTLTQVMSGQIDIGWSSPPFGMEEIENGQIRVIGRGSDVPGLRNQTVRVQVVNANTLSTKRDAVGRFLKAYNETLDWMYSNPEAVVMYAALIHKPEVLVIKARDRFFPKAALRVDRIDGVDAAMKDAVELKFIDKPLADSQLNELYQIVRFSK